MLPNIKFLLFAILCLIFVPTTNTDAQSESLPYQIVGLSARLTGPNDYAYSANDMIYFDEIGKVKHFHLEQCVDDTILIYDLRLAYNADSMVEISAEGISLQAPDCRVENIIAPVQIESRPLLANSDNTLQIILDEFTLDVTISNTTYLCDKAVDTDCDMIPNADEQQLIDTYKPLMIYSPDEPLPLDQIMQVYQVAPTTMTADGPQGALLTIVTLYTQDLGIQAISVDDAVDHLTCNAAIMPAESLLGLPPIPVEGFTTLYNVLGLDLGAHCGDSEAMRVEFIRSDDTWQPTKLHIKRHYDDWEEFPFLVAPYEYADNTHVQLYISAAKHAAYPSLEACAEYSHNLYSFGDVACTFTFEQCGVGVQHYFDIPFELNVGERHHPAFDALSEVGNNSLTTLFGAETAWTDHDFCGGCDDPKAGFLGEACGGALANKWTPVQREERPDLYVPASQVQAPLVEIVMDQPVGEWGWAESEPVPYSGFTAPQAGNGIVVVDNIGGSPYNFYLHGDCGNPQPAFNGLATDYYYFELPAGRYDLCNGQGKLGEVSVYEGQSSTVALDTGKLVILNIGKVHYFVYPMGYFEAGEPPIANAASEYYTFGLRTGIYEIYSGQGYLGRATIYRGQVTTVTLATGLLTINNFGKGYYEVYQAGHHDEKLPFVASGASAVNWFGFRNGNYDIYSGSYRVGQAAIHFGQRSVITLDMGTVRVLDPNGRGYSIFEIGAEYPFANGTTPDWTYALRGFAYVLRVPDQPPIYFVVRQEEALELTIP